MSNFLKKFISYLGRGKIIILPTLFILLFLSFPLPASAQGFWGFVRDAILFLPTLLVATMLVVMLLLTQGIAFLMGALLDWVISPSFVSLSYTIPCPGPTYSATAPGAAANCNPIIGMGLDITQHFVNLLLVVILVYIALSIALRIGEHDAKKIFPKLIIIALLVNFAPVLCGLIVDASNIIMNYFLGPIKGGVSGVLTQVAPFADSVKKAIWGAGGEIANRMGVLALAGAMIFLNLGTALAFFLFAGLFIFRYVALWVLVILSPLAFVFWILPTTEKLWKMWWNNFIQWSIIGIPIAFFLYLALGSFSVLSTVFVANIEAPAIESAALGIFNQLFPFFIVIIFLALGFLIGLSTSAMGAEVIIKGGKAAGMVAGKRMGKGAWRTTKATGQQVISGYKGARAAGSGRARAVFQGAAVPALAAWAKAKAPYLAARAAGRGPIRATAAVPVAALRAVGKGTASVLGAMGVAAYAAALKKGGKGKAKAFCSTCGGATPAGATFCPHCGAVI